VLKVIDAKTLASAARSVRVDPDDIEDRDRCNASPEAFDCGTLAGPAGHVKLGTRSDRDLCDSRRIDGK
jgi:hypothetical protein